MQSKCSRGQPEEVMQGPGEESKGAGSVQGN